jgi:hypothetical protein
MPRDYAELALFGSEDREVGWLSWQAVPVAKQADWVLEKERQVRRKRDRSKEIEEENLAIESEISASSFILGIEEDPDDPDFTPYSADTHERAVTFLRRLALHAHSCGFAGIGVPEILPSGDGSIDLLWRSASRQLLINFSASANDRISFHGRKGGSELAGRFDSTEFRPELVYWLAS